jgi:phosphoserine phosphatase
MLLRQFPRGLVAKLQPLLALEGQTAVFDADGTLWGADASESFMDWMEHHGHLCAPDGATSVLEYYYNLMERDRVASFVWAAQRCVGLEPAAVAEFSEISFTERVADHTYPAMAELVAALQSRGWICWVVSASPKWAVVPGAQRFGIPPERVLALELQVRNGTYIDALVGTVTSGAGKAKRIQEELTSLPCFAAGNSVDDMFLLEEATHCAMVVNPSGLHDAEFDLAAEAIRRGWLVYFP